MFASTSINRPMTYSRTFRYPPHRANSLKPIIQGNNGLDFCAVRNFRSCPSTAHRLSDMSDSTCNCSDRASRDMQHKIRDGTPRL